MAIKDFNKLGHPGKFPEVITLTSGTTWFTGSNYGGAGVIRGTNTVGTVYLSNGGSIDLTDLNAGEVHELSIEHVEGIASGSLYILKRG